MKKFLLLAVVSFFGVHACDNIPEGMADKVNDIIMDEMSRGATGEEAREAAVEYLQSLDNDSAVAVIDLIQGK